MRVLFLGAGRRVSLAQRFKKEGFEVYSYETEMNAPIHEEAKIIKGFKWNDLRTQENIINTIIKYDIKLVIPLQDAATKIASEIKKIDELSDIFPMSDKYCMNMCLNKKKLEDFFIFNNYYPAPNPNFDIIIKPIEGANSKGIKRINYEEYLKLKNTENFKNNYVAQRYIEGNEEYSVDAYFDKNCKMVDCVPRKRLEIQGGEVNRSITVHPETFGLTQLTKKIGEKIKMQGPACFQFIINNFTTPYLMEINGRFGGGVILSLEAGCEMIQWLKKEYIMKEELTKDDKKSWEVGKGMIRYFKESFYENKTN